MLKMYPITLLGELSPMTTPEGAAMLARGRVVLRLDHIALDLAGAEGYGLGHEREGWREPTQPGLEGPRELGAVSVGVRMPIDPWHVRLSFHHHHETGWEEFLAAPGGALLGVSPDIRHMSGAELGLGWTYDWGTLLDGGMGRIVTGVEFTGAVFPAQAGPDWYLGLSLVNGIQVGG